MVRGVKIKSEVEIDAREASTGKSQFKFKEHEILAIDVEINKMLRQKVIEKSLHEDNEIISKIFTREKKDSSALRVILNLKKINQQLEPKKFKMASIRAALDMIYPNVYMGSIDLVNAYFSVSIDRKFRKYFKFVWQGELFQFTCLPNGLCLAPQMFTQLLKPIYASLHEKGHDSTYYLDDSLILGHSESECVKNLQDTVDLFSKLGFFIHKDKSSLIPKRKIEYLGFIINSEEMNISLTEKRKNKLLQACFLVKGSVKVSIRLLASLIGLMVASFLAIPMGKIYYRYLEKEKTVGLRLGKDNWEKKILLSEKALEEIDWWIRNIDSKTPIDRGKPTIIITSDASEKGYGAVCDGRVINGMWTCKEKENHINFLELLAVYFALKVFADNLFGTHIRLRVDNMTVLHLIKNFGTCKTDKLNKLTKKIWEYAMRKQLWLSIEYVKSSENEADEPSRIFNMDAEWQLNPSYFDQAIRLLGFVPKIDLFANRTNAQIAKYVSYAPDPDAYFVDAFNLDWSKLNFYAFPPFNLVLKVLRKIREDNATGIVVYPNWPAQPFFSMANKMLIGTPVVFTPRRNLLIMATEPGSTHRLAKKLSLIIGILS